MTTLETPVKTKPPRRGRLTNPKTPRKPRVVKPKPWIVMTHDHRQDVAQYAAWMEDPTRPAFAGMKDAEEWAEANLDDAEVMIVQVKSRGKIEAQLTKRFIRA